jgi:membrane associated rhomboid family serine protease
MVIPLRDDNPTIRFPVVTVVLIALNCFVYFFLQPHGGAEESRFTLEHAAIPCELRQASPLTVGELVTGDCESFRGPVEDREAFPDKNVWFSIIASLFLHANLWHLAGNLLFLWIFGNNVEERFGYVGYAAFYLMAGVVATGTHVLADWSSTQPLIGASGAIAGVMGAYLVLWPRARVLTWIPLLLIVVIFLPAWLVLAAWFGLQFFTSPDESVAWLAHVGGFVFGVVIAFAVRQLWGPPRPRRAPVEGPPSGGPGWGGPDDPYGGFRGGYPGRD